MALHPSLPHDGWRPCYEFYSSPLLRDDQTWLGSGPNSPFGRRLYRSS